MNPRLAAEAVPAPVSAVLDNVPGRVGAKIPGIGGLPLFVTL